MRRLVVYWIALWSLAAHAQRPDFSAHIAALKPSIVAVGTYKRERNPQFRFLGSGFAVGNGNQIATAAHVVLNIPDFSPPEQHAIAIPRSGRDAEIRFVEIARSNRESDTALLTLSGGPVPTLKLSQALRPEGAAIALTGFPIGAALGLYHTTHKGIISAHTPLAIPMARSEQLNERTLRRLRDEPVTVYQLDLVAYPGASGSPVWDPATGEVFALLNATFVKGSKEAALSAPTGISYAVPIAPLLELLDAERRMAK